MQLPERWWGCESLLRDFNNSGVEYLICGSMAESHFRPVFRVDDMDLLINPTNENAERLKPALEAAAYRSGGLIPSRAHGADDP